MPGSQRMERALAKSTLSVFAQVLQSGMKLEFLLKGGHRLDLIITVTIKLKINPVLYI